MQTSFDNTLVVIFDGNNVSNLLDLFTFNYLPTTIVGNQREFWSKVNKAAEYSFDYILTVDGHAKEPEDFIKLFDKINDAEIVIGSRQGNSLVSTLFNTAYLKLQLYQDWFSALRLYRIETLLNLSKFQFADDLDSLSFQTLAKATELGCTISEVAINQPMTQPRLSLIELGKLWLSLFQYKKSPTYNEQSLY